MAVPGESSRNGHGRADGYGKVPQVGLDEARQRRRLPPLVLLLIALLVVGVPASVLVMRTPMLHGVLLGAGSGGGSTGSGAGSGGTLAVQRSHGSSTTHQDDVEDEPTEEQAKAGGSDDQDDYISEEDVDTMDEDGRTFPPTAVATPPPTSEWEPFTNDSIALQVLNSPKGSLVERNYSEGDLLTSRKHVKFHTGVHIITTFFKGAYHDKRFHEIVATLVSNLENPHVEAVHVLWQGHANPYHYFPDIVRGNENLVRKLVLKWTHKQPTYRALFQYANEELARGAVGIVTNADIYYDSGLGCLQGPDEAHMNTTRHKVYSLSRRHSSLCGHRPDYKHYYDLCIHYIASHDAFVFAPPVPNSVLRTTDHTQNAGYGAENMVIWSFRHARSAVVNPCYAIRGFHLHCSHERHYKTKIINMEDGHKRPGRAHSTHKYTCGAMLF